MAKLQQLVMQIVIGTMVFGGVACMCPASADAQVTPAPAHAHAYHDGMSANPGDQPDCGHEDCEAGCELGSVVASKGSGGAGGKTSFQVDHVPLPPSEIGAFASFSGETVSPAPARLHIPLRQETPVQRCDRLLD